MNTLCTLLVLTIAVPSSEPPKNGRQLTAKEKKEVAKLEEDYRGHLSLGDFKEAVQTANQIVEYRAMRQGHDHWEVIDARWNAKLWQRPVPMCVQLVRAVLVNLAARKLEDERRIREAETEFREALDVFQKILGEQHPITATSYRNLASCLIDQGKHSEALPLYDKVLRLRQKLLGEQHPDTAQCYVGLGSCLDAQGKHAAALAVHQKALAIYRNVLGEQHPKTANSCNHVASCLNNQGKHAEALSLYQKALAMRLKALGERHDSTASSYSNVAYCLDDLGRHAEAMPLHLIALDIRRKVLSEQHPSTATSYNNLASCLNAQGKRTEALPLYEKALAIFQTALGDRHPSTATSYNNVAYCLRALGKHTKALTLYQRALTIRQKVLGEHHPSTANSYNNLAACLHSQGKAADALPLYQKALAIHQKLGRKHNLGVANTCNNIAGCLDDQGKHAEALPLFEKARAIRQNVLGEQHPETANSYINVAACLYGLGKYHEARRNFEAALVGGEFGRLKAARTGFERSHFRSSRLSPRKALAVCLLRLNKPLQAWEHAEANLARGLLDDLLLSSETPADADKLARLNQLEKALIPLLTQEKLAPEETKQRDTLLEKRNEVSAELAESAVRRSRNRVLSLASIQKQIPADAAIVFWHDGGGLDQHRGCIVHREGPPVWVRLPGSGKKDAWTSDDDAMPRRALQVLSDASSKATDRNKLLGRLYRLRMAPLEPHLKGIRHLLVVSAGRMSAVPVDVLTDRYLISYVSSGSVFARGMEKHRGVKASSLLVLADPVYTRTAPKWPPAPPHGLLVKAVLPNSLAARIRLVLGDVVMEYDGMKLMKPDDLKPATGKERVAIKLWRAGKMMTGRIPSGKLGVVVDKQPIATALAEWRKGEEKLQSIGRGGEWQALPGTRLEARTLASLIPDTDVMLGSDASEQKLAELASSGKLKKYRIVHLATHGEANSDQPKLSSLILAQDRLPTPDEAAKQVLKGKKPIEGKLTVDTILKHWDLDADLVVLSACQTGIGMPTSAEGMLGFTQALLQKNARSVVLSRWKVDDAATSLLMARFYQNLLGERAGLKQPMKRAEALDDAKRWLRNLTRAEAEKRLAKLVDGVPRGERGTIKAALPARKPDVPTDKDRPFAHPYYWAAFVLIGDPH